jgi:hypothetical protein
MAEGHEALRMLDADKGAVAFNPIDPPSYLALRLLLVSRLLT